MLTLAVDGVTILGPSGGCVRDQQNTGGGEPVIQLELGETVRISGSIAFQPADTTGRGCVPRPVEAGAAIPFSAELSYDDLASARTVSLIIHDPDAAVRTNDSVIGAITFSPPG